MGTAISDNHTKCKQFNFCILKQLCPLLTAGYFTHFTHPTWVNECRSGASSDVESTLTATNLRRIVFQEDETQGDR